MKTFPLAAAAAALLLALPTAARAEHTCTVRVEPGHYEVRTQQVTVPGRYVWETQTVQVPGRWEVVQEEVQIPGRYELQTRRVLVQPGHWVATPCSCRHGARATIDAGPVRFSFGRRSRRARHHTCTTHRRWQEPRYETRRERVWVPGRTETRPVRKWIAPTTHTQRVRVWKAPGTEQRQVRVWVPARRVSCCEGRPTRQATHRPARRWTVDVGPARITLPRATPWTPDCD